MQLIQLAMAQICTKVLILLTVSASVITSSKNPDLSLQQSFDHDNSIGNGGECPTWMYRANESEKCICGVDNYHTVKCDQSVEKVYILDSYLMTFDEEYNEVVVGASLYGVGLYNNSSKYDIYHAVPMNQSLLNEFMCGQFNRKGRLCGECEDGYSPLAYSYNMHCTKCPSEESIWNIFRFLSVAFIPLTGFYVIVVLFKFNANSPIIHGFILYAQLVSAPFVIRILLLNAYSTIGIQFFATLYGIWNLNFFRTLYPNMCLNLTTLQVIALDYIITFYRCLLMLLTTIAFKLLSTDSKIIRFLRNHFRRCIKKTGLERL